MSISPYRMAASPLSPDAIRRAVASRRRRLFLGLLVSIICLGLTLQGVDLVRVLSLLRRTNPWLAALGLLGSLAVYVVTAVRWQLLFPPGARPRLRHLFGALMLAQLVNSLLPARLGPFARAYGLRRQPGLGSTFILSTVVVEKLLEGVTLLPFALVILLLGPWPSWLKRSATLSAALLTASLVVLGAGWVYRHRLIAWLDRLTRRMPDRLSPWMLIPIRDAFTQWEAWYHAQAGWELWVWSLLVWGVTILFNYVVLLALGIPAPFAAALWLLVVLQIGGRLPSAPAGIGVFHYLTVVTLSLFAVDRAAALGYGILLHALIYLPASALGAGYLWYASGDLATTATPTTEER